jgi:hypothetical protein
MGAKHWTFEEIAQARAYMRGETSKRPDRSPAALRAKFDDEVWFLTIERWGHVPGAERHRLTKALVSAASAERVALGEKNNAQIFVERFTSRILPQAILRRDDYPLDGDEWAAEVRAALWATTKPKVSA